MPEGQELLINGFRIGSLVKLTGITGDEVIPSTGKALSTLNGELGQIVSYAGDADKFYIYLVNGFAVYVDPKNLSHPEESEMLKPGEAGGSDAFDLLMAPMTSSETLGKEVSSCLFEKGFCMLKLAQFETLMEPTQRCLDTWDSQGKLVRFPEEVEEGYLGKSCKGKVSWLDDPELAQDDFLSSCNDNLTHIARVFEPYARDTLGECVMDRTPALICQSLSYAGVQEYPYPMADDRTLGDFLNTWRRSLVRLVHFMGPANVTLEAKEDAKIPKPPQSLRLSVSVNTILIYRPDVYEYHCESEQDTVMLITNLLSAAPNMILAHVEGDADVLTAGTMGPPPPSPARHGGVIDVVNIVSRCSGRFDDGPSYKNGLAAGTDGVVKIPITRWDVDPYYVDSEFMEPWQLNNKHQGYIDGCEMFDNRYFEISNSEANNMDPVQRQVMEVGGMSLAMQGITKKVTNKGPIHAGFSVGNDKLDWNNVPKDPSMGGGQNVLAIIANRFSFVFNLKGPNFVCDTACSASLVSSHLAKLMLYESTYDKLEFHISLGAHLVLHPGPFIGCCQSHMSTIKGRCFTFNNSADGYLRGEACAGMMLKLGNDREEADGILRSTAAGQDGRSASLTAPNGPAQEEMINRAIREAQMSPTESTVWECHGTGTSLGDPIEVGAVRKTQVKQQRVDPLLMGSNKSNFGHGEGAAGMCGMVKCVIQVKSAKCMPTLHVRSLNPHLEHTKFEAHFETESMSYPYIQGHSQVSSFGFGGTNGHACFWGTDRSEGAKIDTPSAFAKKLRESAVPEIRPLGNSPDDWESDWPDTRGMPKSAKWLIKFDARDPPEAPLKYVLADDGLADLDEVDDHSYSIAGNFNDWESDPMVAGEVQGLWTANLEIPDLGYISFHIQEDGVVDKVICPEIPDCSRKTTAIIGPDVEVTNNWIIHGEAGMDVSIEFFCQSGVRSILWVKG